MFFRYDELDDQQMPYHESRRRVDVTHGVHARSDGGRELEFDLSATDGVEIGLPALFDRVAADVAHFLVLLTFALAANFVPVLGAGGGDILAMFVDAPIKLLDPPAGLRCLLFLHDAIHAELDEEGADGVDNWSVDDVDGEVCRGKDAERLLFRRWLESSLNAERVLVGDDVCQSGVGSDFEGIVDVGQSAVGGGWQVPRQQIGKRELVGAVIVSGGLGDEVPGLQGGDLVATVRAVLSHRLLGQGAGSEVHADGSQADLGVGDDESQLTGEQGARGGGTAVEDARWGFHLNLNLGRFGGGDPRTAFVLGGGVAGGGVALLLGAKVKEVHCCRMSLVFAGLEVSTQVIRVRWSVLGVTSLREMASEGQDSAGHGQQETSQGRAMGPVCSKGMERRMGCAVPSQIDGSQSLLLLLCPALADARAADS